MDINNLSIVRQSFANTVFTHKVQEVAAELHGKKANTIRVINIVLVSIVLILLVIQTIYPTAIILTYIGAGVTAGEILFLIIQLSFNFEQRAVLHKNSALKFMGLRDKYRSLITDIMSETLSSDEVISRRDSLLHEYQVLSDLSPQTGSKEYKEAQKRLNKRGVINGEEFTWSDEEIDWFLPEKLRISTI